MRQATPEEIAELEALYAQVPQVNCRGLCQGACGPIGMGDAEYARLQGDVMPAIARADRVGLSFKQASCPALTMLGRCSVYELRPMVCRIWGAVKSMRCSHGCRPEGGWLSEVDGQILLLRSKQVGATEKERGFYEQIIERLRSDAEMSQALAERIWAEGNSAIPPRVQASIIARFEQLASARDT